MARQKTENSPPADPRDSFEPYVQLIRSLLPRASSVAIFDTKGGLRWSSETTTGPDLVNVVDDALSVAHTTPDSAGQLRVLDGNMPVYLCWLRDDTARLLAVLAVVCRATGDQDVDARSFSFAYALLRPAIECLRRDLMARVAIDSLNRTVTALDKDLELLLADGAPDHKSQRVDRSRQEHCAGPLAQQRAALGHATRRARAPSTPVHGAAAPRAGDHQQARAQQYVGDHAVPDSVLPAALAGGPHHRRAGHVPRRPG
jgi:hypothetical protein